MICQDKTYMQRALQLAKCGEGHVSPNPMVGAVIVAPSGRIIGEGYHRRYGGPHAEVNAVASVREEDLPLLRESTMYVTLEPCSHYGKTPPCALMLVEKGIPHVVVATTDPNPKVAGRGIRIMEEAGIKVETGCLGKEARHLNRRFFTAHTLHRPWVILKWAQSEDGFLASCDSEGKGCPVKLSSPLSEIFMHRERAMVDAIMVGTNTANSDNPSLTLRLWPGRKSPVPLTFDVHNHLRPDLRLLENEETIVISDRRPLPDILHSLYADRGITSLMVEGGASLLSSFLKEGLADEIRVETAPKVINQGIKAPEIHSLPSHIQHIGNNTIYFFSEKSNF